MAQKVQPKYFVFLSFTHEGHTNATKWSILWIPFYSYCFKKYNNLNVREFFAGETLFDTQLQTKLALRGPQAWKINLTLFATRLMEVDNDNHI